MKNVIYLLKYSCKLMNAQCTNIQYKHAILDNPALYKLIHQYLLNIVKHLD